MAARKALPAIPPSSPPAQTSGTSLTITATIDPAFNSTEVGVINSAIAFYQNTFTNPINVTITFQKVSSGFAASSTTLCNVDYQTFSTTLQASATSPDQMLVFSSGVVPVTMNNPVSNTTNIIVKTANIKALGLSVSTLCGGPVPSDGTVMLNASFIESNGFSLLAATEHEINEVLGLGSALAAPPQSSFTDPLPEDLFRFSSTANVRSFSTNPQTSLNCAGAPRAIFTLDGTTAVDDFNNCNNGGDYGDWITHTPSQVQDAFTNGTGSPMMTTTSPETRALNVIGYTLPPSAPNPPGSFQATPH